MNVVSAELLTGLAGFTPVQSSVATAMRPGGVPFDLSAWIEKYGIPVKQPTEWNGGTRWVFSVCPWNSDHINNSAFIVQFPNGAISAGCHHNGCADRGWTELRRLFEPNYSPQARADTPPASLEWESAIPLLQVELPQFPVNIFPPWLREFVEALAEATQTPVDLAGMLALSVIATATARKVIVQIRPGYEEPVNVFVVVSMPPANRKSAVFRAMVRRIEEFERLEAKTMEATIARQQNLVEIEEARLKQIRGKATTAKAADRHMLIEEASDLAATIAAMPVSTSPRLIVDDCTPEKLAKLLQEQNGRLAVLSAEGDVFEILAGRYSSGVGNFGVYLRGHAGDPIRVDRVGRPPEFVDAPALTVGLAVQPAVIRGLVTKDGFRGRGLLGRFLYSLPESMLGRRKVSVESVAEGVRASYEQNISKLLSIPVPEPDEDFPQCHVLVLDPAAERAFMTFQAWLEPKLAEFGELGQISDWAGKLSGAVARITGLLHMADYADWPEPWKEPVSKVSVDRAVALAHYLIPHARAAFVEMGTDETHDEAKLILRWIEERQVKLFSKRELFQGLKGTFKVVETLLAPLALLVSHGYIRPLQSVSTPGPGRKPSPVYEVNPIWLASGGVRQ